MLCGGHPGQTLVVRSRARLAMIPRCGFLLSGFRPHRGVVRPAGGGHPPLCWPAVPSGRKIPAGPSAPRGWAGTNVSRETVSTRRYDSIMRPNWEATIIISVALVGAVVLLAMGKDASALLALLAALIGALTWQKAGIIERQTNGNITALTQELAATREALGRSVPADVAQSIAGVKSEESAS